MKGQLFSSDFVVSMMVFMGILGLGVFALNEAVSGQTRFNEHNRMVKEAYRTSDLLVRTPGYPEGWTSSNVQIVGLAESNHVLENAKLQEFENIPTYEEKKGVLELSQWEFNMTVRVNGSVATVRTATGLLDPSFGRPVWANATDVAPAKRSVVVNTTDGMTPGTLEVVVWD